MKKKLTTIFLFSIILILISCGKSFVKNPIDDMIKNMDKVESFSIVLYDMDVEGFIFDTYKHKYKVIEEVDGKVDEKTTKWIEVSKNFFAQNENNMGMEIASKSKDGKISKIAAPPGYSNYVGNSRYGHWENRNGNSFWVFYGQYAMLSNLLNMGRYPAYRTSWDTYDRSYRGKTSYYGTKASDGKYRYGTNSAFTKRTNPNSRFNKKFSQRSRSSSRYNSGFSSRSRSGGFGK